MFFSLSFCQPSSSSLPWIFLTYRSDMALDGEVPPAVLQGRLRALVGALLVLPSVEHITTLQWVPEGFLPSWLKTGCELRTSYDSDLLDHLIVCPSLDKIIHAVFLCTLSSSIAFTTKPCIPLHGLEPHNPHDKGPTHHSANEAIDLKRALKQSAKHLARSPPRCQSDKGIV